MVITFMFRPIVCWIHVIALLATSQPAFAHTGYENETAVRLFADRMDVNVRATFGFAWKILGHRAPNGIGEAGQQVAGPLLAAEAPGLFDVTAGGKTMVARRADCKFELEEHVLFRLTYDRPPVWPLVLKARFFDSFDPLTYGTVRVFDQTDDPFRRDIEPSAEEKIHRAKPVFSYAPTPPAEVVADAPAFPAPHPEKPKPPGFRGLWVTPLLLVLVLWLLRLILKRPGK